jgi:GNAT superfamily N-acetyltransferase
MKNGYRIRNRSPKKDDKVLLRLINNHLRQYPSARGWTDYKIVTLLNQSSRVVVLENSRGRQIGFLSWKEEPPFLILGLCVIKAAYQRKGIATRYFQRLEKYAKHLGCNTLRLYVDIKNKDAITLYRNFGFQKTKMNMFTNTTLMEKELL